MGAMEDTRKKAPQNIMEVFITLIDIFMIQITKA